MKKIIGLLVVIMALAFLSGCQSQQPSVTNVWINEGSTNPQVANTLPEVVAQDSSGDQTPTPAITAPKTTQPLSGMANPASTYCVQQGGQLTMQTDPKGGQYGVCVFEDNLQCEEWAMYRKECPLGGVKITGYATESGRYCAITGGKYIDVKVDKKTKQETGKCQLPNGKICDASQYLNHSCPK